ncbi:ABC transporter C family member 3 [Acorus calamus]|uniref:ABC transporter C family member 3 n=1 Tax=Acorus calamus TaxID=4465 RepID=A0AAV9C2F3_ACOCL|nr:ABC transporter C family member 3 [Acorus calamus]
MADVGVSPKVGHPIRPHQRTERESSRESREHGLSQFLQPCILTFFWMNSLFSVGNKKTLDIEDIPRLVNEDSVFRVFPVFQTNLDSCSNCGEIGTLELVKALVYTTWKNILLTGLFALIYTISTYVGPYLIGEFVQYLIDRDKYPNRGYVLVSAFVVAKILECLSQRHWFFRIQQVNIRVRSVLVTMIYKKGLKLSSQSRQGRTSGEIINIMSVDADRIGLIGWYIHDLWMIPVQVTLALLILYKNLGLASLATLAATILIMLVNFPLGKMQQKYQEGLMKSKDVRMKATSEILRNMRILKLQGWEMKFLSKIVELRKNETNWLIKLLYTEAMTMFFLWASPTLVSVVTFGACMLMGIPLDSGKVLSALATFAVLQAPIYGLPDTIQIVVQNKVSLDRISSFLCLEDLQHDFIEKPPKGSTDVAVEISAGNFSWGPSSSNPTLKDLNVRVLHGMRVAVCGTVGSGKSSLVSCILGEIPKTSGTIKLCGTTAYVAQTPWIQSGKIEDNVLFGEEMERLRYERVLEACSLKKDLEILPFGDQTIIGERGINLSGGQKQRIQIARALYHGADIYLFDDPFSAVDAHTGSHLFKECLLGLLASKTVIYVTHQMEFLTSADLILVMKDGKITQTGRYEDILNSGTDLIELVGAHEKALSALDSMELKAKTSADVCVENVEEMKDEHNGEMNDISVPKGQLVQEEEREKGRIGSNYWMAWAAPVAEDATPRVTGSLLILVYVILALGSSLCLLVRDLLLTTAGYKTATLLFNKLHTCIFRAPMSFFDATPSGRILNRASTDQSEVDTLLPSRMGNLAFTFIQLLGIIAVMSQVAWQVFIIFIPVIATCIWYQGIINPAIAGLAVTYGLNLNSIQGWVIWRLCNVENQIVSVERILQYTCIPSEPPLTIEANKPDDNWPLCGEVQIHDLQVRYAPHMPFVLRGLSCTFLGGMKTGIVGRTGSGKSTLIQTLFRIIDPTVGHITIDGIDISTIGLHDLRSRLSIIPQDPTMFEGTVRSNLDPLDEYTDEQVWDAIDRCQLGEEVRRKEGKLYSSVSENGENWSVGQRQLVCLGRVILKKSKVLVLDEATASVDTSTDSLIQNTLRQQFSDSTVITIAHRITSVLDSDMVLLLDNGKILEFDTPGRLLENKSSGFAKLVAEYTKTWILANPFVGFRYCVSVGRFNPMLCRIVWEEK